MSDVLHRFSLDDRESAYFRPLCSEDGCQAPAILIIGHYESEDAMQGEHSKFGGWFFCEKHAVQFAERRKRESEARG